MSTPVTPQEFREAADRYGDHFGLQPWRTLLLAAAEQGEQLDVIKSRVTPHEVEQFWLQVEGRLEQEKTELREQIATLTVEVRHTKELTDAVVSFLELLKADSIDEALMEIVNRDTELSEARTALTQAVEQIRVLKAKYGR